MMFRIYNSLILLVFITHFTAAQNSPVFEDVSSEVSGITFQNTIQENLSSKENLFDFDYFYNGAGVGVGDINNDGLLDLIFCGNQQPNELYINKGNNQFKKLEGALNVYGKKYWSNGVTVVDINNDGYLDIYISQGGPHVSEKRKNLLFINNGELTFSESASLYGLDDEGISTQSAFFDFDKDGDLDCVVMNENSFYGRDPISFYQDVGENEDDFWRSCSHFYINEGGKFKDATAEVGLLKPSFGLGLSVSDINHDGWIDIYIANDYYIPDAMYINNKNGTFSDQIKERTDQISFYGMGVDIADINNDGSQDIFVLDMASSDHYRSKTLMRSMNVSNFRLLVESLRFPHQYMFNSLQLADENEKFFNVSQFSGIAKTDWSWSVLMNDFDLDGHKDIFISNGYRRYALDNDFQNEVATVQRTYQGSVPLSEKKKLYDSMPTEALSNVIYQNQGNTSFNDVTGDWGLNKPTYSNGAAVGDLDNDGDLDLVINNIDDEASLYINKSRENGAGNFIKIMDEEGDPFFSATIKLDDGTKQFAESKTVRGYMSSSEEGVYFGLGSRKRIEELEVRWTDGSILKKKKVKANQILTVSKPNKIKDSKTRTEVTQNYLAIDPKDIGIDFFHNENEYNDFSKEILLPYKQSTLGPNIVKNDFNNDGLEDIFILGASGQSNQLYVQTAESWENVPLPIFEEDKQFEDLDAIFFDLNSDGWNDIYMITGGNEKRRGDTIYNDRIYINDSGKGFHRHQSLVLEQLQFSGKDGEVIDFDEDGDDDLIIANRIVPQMYPYSAPSFIFENREGKLVNVTRDIAPELRKFGIINDLEVVDINNDGTEDFIAVGEWSSIGIFINENGQFANMAHKYGVDNNKGWWYSVTEVNISKDNQPDFIVGNIGLNSKYKSSKENPLRVYAGDMDENGTWDLVLSKKYKDKYVPFRGKECSTQQMPFVSEKFPTYDLFASASIEEVYGKGLEKSYEEEVNVFYSIALISQDDEYRIEKLPIEAQYFPVLDGVTIKDDIILAGNIYNTEVETPRLDMGRGVVLNPSNNRLKLSASFNSGLVLDENVKSLEFFYHKGKDRTYILAGVNNGTLKVVERQ